MKRRRPERVLRDGPAVRDHAEVDVGGARRRRRRRQHREDRRVRMVVADGVDRVEALRGRTCTARTCRATRRCRAASGRSSLPTACPGTSRRRGSRRRAPRTRRRAPGSRASSRARSCRSARARAAGSARRSSRRRSRAPARRARRGTSRRAARRRSRRARRAGCRAPCAPSARLAAARATARRRRRRRSGRSSTRSPRTGARRRPTAAAGSPLPPIVTSPATKSVGSFRDRQRPPAQLIRRRRRFVERRAANQARRDLAKRLVHGRRPNPIRPAAPARGARRREARAVDLLGVEAVRRLLRIALPDGQRARQRFAREVVAEPGLVAKSSGVHAGRAAEPLRRIVNRRRGRLRYSSGPSTEEPA